MSYSSPLYLFLFLPLVILLYKIVPKPGRRWVLLLANITFFCLISRVLIVYLFASIGVIYGIALWLQALKARHEEEKLTSTDKSALKKRDLRRRRGVLALGIVANLGILVVLKYLGFFANVLEALVPALSFSVPHLLVPIGISFYTLQAIAYMTDVYRGTIEADRNVLRLTLYMSFFPAIMEGPICRYKEIAPALFDGPDLTYHGLTFGLQRILWGMFKKLVIADRLAPLVKQVFTNYTDYGGLVIVGVAVLYTFQLYADFSGCIDISIGTGEIFGITLPENFRQPFFAKSASEFWRRWHMSLGEWFKDYIFFPVSLSKETKALGKKAKALLGKEYGQILATVPALFAVWLATGLWHGAGTTYLFYGLYYFVLILLGNLLEPLIARVTKALKINRTALPYRVFQSVKLLVIVFTGELIFRAPSLNVAFAMLKSVVTDFHFSVLTDGTFLRLGLAMQDYVVLLVGFIAVLVVGILHERGVKIREALARKPLVLRWSLYYATIMAIAIFGLYGESSMPVDPIYAGF